MIERVICIGCPLGCQAQLEIDERGEVVKLSGCRCKQGRRYVLEEYHHPVRIFTSTVPTEGSSQPLLPVRTDKPIPKTRLKEAARVLVKMKVRPPIKSGQVLHSNLLDTGANLIAAGDLPS